MLSKYKKYMSKAYRLLYEHSCTTFEYRDIKDPITKITTSQEVEVLKDEPCRLSYENVVHTNQTESTNVVKQVIKLFISPDVHINEGSKILIKHDGKIEEFRNSGRPALYSSNQEIILEFIGAA